MLASVNLLRHEARARRAGAGAGEPARVLRGLVGGEAILVAAAIFAAAVLSSLPPPLVGPREDREGERAHGPGPRDERRRRERVPDRAPRPSEQGRRAERVLGRDHRGGKPVRNADVIGTFTMLDMEMPSQSYRLAETAPGVYDARGPALVMVGHWGLSFDIDPRGAQPFTVLFVDRANG